MLRLMQIVLPRGKSEGVEEKLGEEKTLAVWRQEESDERLVLSVLVTAEQAEPVMDAMEEKFAGMDDFHVVLLPVEAALPRPEEDEEEEDEEGAGGEEEEKPRTFGRVSREELHADITEGVKVNPVFVAMVVFSSVVAAVGLMRDNVAVVIGAMVVAPLLTPNVALALATTLGDFKLGVQALRANLAGLAIALSLSVLTGALLPVDPSAQEIASRTDVGLPDIVLALAAGSAGTLAFTSGLSAVVIGVMVAVALLPPLVVVGLLLGAGLFDLALGAFLLLAANVVCVNLAGVSTFLAQGVRPRTWWEADQAKRSTRIAIALWSAALLLLIAVLYLAGLD